MNYSFIFLFTLCMIFPQLDAMNPSAHNPDNINLGAIKGVFMLEGENEDGAFTRLYAKIGELKEEGISRTITLQAIKKHKHNEVTACIITTGNNNEYKEEKVASVYFDRLKDQLPKNRTNRFMHYV